MCVGVGENLPLVGWLAGEGVGSVCVLTLGPAGCWLTGGLVGTCTAVAVSPFEDSHIISVRRRQKKVKHREVERGQEREVKRERSREREREREKSGNRGRFLLLFSPMPHGTDWTGLCLDCCDRANSTALCILWA